MTGFKLANCDLPYIRKYWQHDFTKPGETESINWCQSEQEAKKQAKTMESVCKKLMFVYYYCLHSVGCLTMMDQEQ